MNILTVLAEGFADSSFARLFTDMNALTAILFIVGLIFCMVELFMPGFGFFGITGIILLVAGIITRLVYGGDALMLLYMVLIVSVVLIVMFVILSRLIAKGRLGKTAMFNVASSVSEDRTEGTLDFSDYLNKVGTTQTVLRPVGKAVFDGVALDVVARDGFIPSDTAVECVQVEGQRVVVVIYDATTHQKGDQE